MGREAFRFVDWLAERGFSVWQVLPLAPTHDDLSPYLGFSSFAGNPKLIDLSALAEDAELAGSWLREGLQEPDRGAGGDLALALAPFCREGAVEDLPGGAEFLRENCGWLPDYARFMTLRREQGGRFWVEWDPPLRDRDEAAMVAVLERRGDLYRAHLVEQYLFERQWRAVKRSANRAGISIFGDAPLYVAHDSADTWANRDYFALDGEGRASRIAGTPPDMFAETGQVWGNPVYEWDVLRRDGFRWWVARIRRQLRLFDLLRIDHFRGLQAYWSIPAGAETAAEGEWVEAPGAELLQALHNELGALPLVAEDLGYITPEVHALRRRSGLPTMRVLQFAFDGSPDNPHLPQNTPENAVAYTGTHDNDTTLGWFRSLHAEARDYVRTTLGIGPEDDILDAMTGAVLGSPARLAVLPVQDLLGLGSEARMNLPGTVGGNWRWQLARDQLDEVEAERWRGRLAAAGRG